MTRAVPLLASGAAAVHGSSSASSCAMLTMAGCSVSGKLKQFSASEQVAHHSLQGKCAALSRCHAHWLAS